MLQAHTHTHRLLWPPKNPQKQNFLIATRKDMTIISTKRIECCAHTGIIFLLQIKLGM